MPENKSSLDKKLKADGWKIQRYIADENLYEELIEIAFAMRANEFKQCRLVPTELITMEREDIVSGGHLLYVKPRPEYSKDWKTGSMFIPCEAKRTGEQIFFLLPYD